MSGLVLGGGKHLFYCLCPEAGLTRLDLRMLSLRAGRTGVETTFLSDVVLHVDLLAS